MSANTFEQFLRLLFVADLVYVALIAVLLHAPILVTHAYPHQLLQRPLQFRLSLQLQDLL